MLQNSSELYPPGSVTFLATRSSLLAGKRNWPAARSDNPLRSMPLKEEKGQKKPGRYACLCEAERADWISRIHASALHVQPNADHAQGRVSAKQSALIGSAEPTLQHCMFK